MFPVNEEEQLIFDNRPTEAKALLSAAGFRLYEFVETACPDFLITPEVKSTAVKLVATGTCVDIDSPGGGLGG